MTNVMTVTGPIDARELGITLPHEHVFVNTTPEYRGNGLLNDERLAIDELKAFAKAGGRTITELSLREIGRDPAALKRVSQASNVQIIMGCGHYRDPYLDRDWFDRNSVDVIADEMVQEIACGVGDTGVRPGIIGEIGADKWYVSAAEERSFRAAARAHEKTGLTITTHAARWPIGRAQLEILTHEGVDPRRIIVGHCDTVPEPGYHLELARAGCYVEFDSIGTGSSRTDDLVLEYTMALIRAGKIENILLSQDVFLLSHMKAEGGNGYAHILTDFVPRLSKAGLSQDEIDCILIENPRAALTGERC